MCTMFLVGGHIYTERDCSQRFFLLHTELTCISRMQFLSTIKRWDTHSVLLLFKIACWSNTNSATDFPHYSAPRPSWLLQIVGCCEIRFPIVTCPWGAKMIFLQWHIHQQPTKKHYYQTRVDFGHLEFYGCSRRWGWRQRIRVPWKQKNETHHFRAVQVGPPSRHCSSGPEGCESPLPRKQRTGRDHSPCVHIKRDKEAFWWHYCPTICKPHFVPNILVRSKLPNAYGMPPCWANVPCQPSQILVLP